MSGNDKNKEFENIDANSSNQSLPASASYTELNSGELMDNKYEGDGLTDVDYKPGADFEVDDTLFQGMTMKEDFLDFTMTYADHAYCNAELETAESSGEINAMIEVGNEEEIRADVDLFQDVGDKAVVDDSGHPLKKRTKLEDSKTTDEKDVGPTDEKRKIPIVKTYNMRSKRFVADESRADDTEKNSGGKGGQLARKRKVEPAKTVKSDSSNEEEEDDEEEEEEEEVSSDEDLPVQNKKKLKKKGTGIKGKGKGKAKNAKGKKVVKGKQASKKTAKSESEDEDEEGEDEEPAAAKNSRKVNRRGKGAPGKQKGKRRKKQETESSEELSEEEEEEESEDEPEETPVRRGKGAQKRAAAKGKTGQPTEKKRKVLKKSALKAAEESESDELSSDSLPLKEVKKLNKRKNKCQKKTKKEEPEENSEEEEEDEEEDDDADVDNMEEVPTEKMHNSSRDPILLALTRGPGTLTDDSGSICSNEDGTPGKRTSSRIKKPNRLYATDNASGLLGGRTTAAAAAQKKEKLIKTKNKEQPVSKEPETAELDISETTDTDALVIDESPVKISALVRAKQEPLTEVFETEYEKPGVEQENVEEEEDSNRSGELTETVDDNNSGTPEAMDGIKRSARLKLLEEATQEKFKALRAERGKAEAKSEAMRKKSLEKVEIEIGNIEKEEKPKPTPKVSKDVPKPNTAAVKNPCRGPGCFNGSLPNSVYCSDVCIQNHAQESINLIEQDRQKSQPQRPRTEGSIAQSKSDERIVVFERKTGKLLTGPVAPTESTLLAWLKRHPTFEVLQPSHHSPAASFIARKDKKTEKKMPVKEIKQPATKETTKQVLPAIIPHRELPHRELDFPVYGAAKEEKVKPVASQPRPLEVSSVHRVFTKTTPDVSSGSSYSRGGPDPARISIRNTLRETLFSRANETDDVMLSGPEIKRLALDIEQELFGYYGEVNTKYKHKYRTLITHLKDPTNKGLFRKVLFGELKPNRLVRLSSESLGSRDLAYWKESGTKAHTQVIQENIYDARPTKKTEFVPKSPFYEPNYDYLSSIIVDTTSNHGNHFFDINCKICTGKIPDPLYYDGGKTSMTVTTPREETVTSVIADVDPVATSKLTKDDDYSSSTIEVSRDPRRLKSTAIAVSAGASSTSLVSTSKAEEKMALLSPPTIVSPISLGTVSVDNSSGFQMGQVEPLVLWKGSIYAHDVAKVMVCAYLVSGSLPVLKEDLSDLIVISGRLPPDNVYSYLSQIKQSGTVNKDVAVVRFESSGINDDELYNQLFSYLHSRDRCGVVSGCSGPTVKDLYIVPVATNSGLPSVLLPSDGPGLSDSHPNLLLGIIIKHTARRPSLTSQPPAVKPLMSTKTWMYSERTEKEEPYSESRRSASRHGSKQAELTAAVATDIRLEPVEEYTPLLPSLGSKQQLISSSASKLEDVGTAESSGTSDIDDDLSEVARKDPIISKYSRFDKSSKVLSKKSVAIDFDDDKPYDPFEEEDNKPYDPCSPEYIATTKATTTTIAGATSKSSWSSAVIPTTTTQPSALMTSSSTSEIDLTQLFKPMSGLSNATDVTAAMLTTLAAISATTSIDEQQRLLSELTERINEQRLHLDKEKEDLKTDESLARGSNLPSFGQSGIGSDGSLGSHGPFLIPSSASSTIASVLSSFGSSEPESSAAFSKFSTETLTSTSIPGFNLDSSLRLKYSAALSQLPVDSGAIPNLARKRLAQKASSDSLSNLSKQEPMTQVTSVQPEANSSGTEPSTTTDTLGQKASIPSTPSEPDATSQPAFTCNLSILPPSVQQLLSGQSFENLKSIIANVTGKKSSDGSVGNTTEGADDPSIRKQLKTELGTVTSKGSVDDKTESKQSNKSLFAANLHGDIDYRVQARSSDTPLMPPPQPNVPVFLNFTASGNSQTRMSIPMDMRPPLLNPALFRSGGSSAGKPMPRTAEPTPFRASMQALLETPVDPGLRVSAEIKQPLLKTPQTSDQDSTQEKRSADLVQPPILSHLQRPFVSEMLRPPFFGDNQQPHFSLEKGGPSFSTESQRFRNKPESQKAFQPDTSKPPLLEQPPLPPQMPRPPFPPGMQRPPFLLDVPKPPFKLDVPRTGSTSKNTSSSGQDSLAGSHQSSDSGTRFSSGGLLPLPTTMAVTSSQKQAGRNPDLSSPSDKYFVAQPLRQTNTNASETNVNTTEVKKSFAVGDLLKQLDNSKTNAVKISADKSDTLQVTSPDDSAYRERKVLLPTPNAESTRKTAERSQEVNKKKTEDQQHGLKEAESGAPVRKWSAKSDWDRSSSENSNNNLKKDEKEDLALIPLPSDSSSKNATGSKPEGIKAGNNMAEVCKADGSKVESSKEVSIASKTERQPSSEREYKSQSSDRSRSHSRRRDLKELSADSRSHRSDRGHRRSRSRDRHKRSRDQSDRLKARARDRPTTGYFARSRGRHSNNEQGRRPFHNRRNSPSAELKKHKDDNDDDGTSRPRNRNHDIPITSDQAERNPMQSNKPVQGSNSSADNIGTKQSGAGIPSLMDMIESSSSETQTVVKPSIPSLLDIMGVSRDSISQPSKPVPGGHGAAFSVTDMKYRRDYKHGADTEEDAGKPGRQRIQQRFQRDLPDERQTSSMEMLEGYSYGAPGNAYGRQYLETTGPAKRPLIDRPPKGDFENPEFGRSMDMHQERGNRENNQDLRFHDNSTNMPNTGYRTGIGNERFAEREGRQRGELGPEGNRMPNEFLRGRPPQFPGQQNPERQAYGMGQNSMKHMETDETRRRFPSPSMSKKCLLGDYPGTGADFEESSSDNGHYEPQSKGDGLSRERGTVSDERHLNRNPHMPEPFQIKEGQQTPPVRPPYMESTPGQSRMPFPRFPSNMPPVRQNFPPVPPPQRPPLGPFGEQSGFPMMPPRMRMPSQFGEAVEPLPPENSEPQSWQMHNRLSENRTHPFPSSDMDAGGMSEKKTLLPMPPVPGPRLMEMPVRLGAGPPRMPPDMQIRSGPGPRPPMDMPIRGGTGSRPPGPPSHFDGPPMLMARPGGPPMRMPPRFPMQRPMNFPDGPHQPGQRPPAPGDLRLRGPTM